jgi:hypothetical protein
MTIVTTHTMTGATNAGFYKNTPEFAKYLKDTYINTGLVTETTTYSEDKKSKTVTTTFKDDAARDKFTTDPLIIANGDNRAISHIEQDIIDSVNE